MEYVTLGKTGLRVSRMGLGGIPIQKIDAEGTKTLLHKLADRGVIILIQPEDIRSVKNIWDMHWKVSGTDL